MFMPIVFAYSGHRVNRNPSYTDTIFRTPLGVGWENQRDSSLVVGAGLGDELAQDIQRRVSLININVRPDVDNVVI